MGSVRQRSDDGRWFIQWVDGGGTQRQKTLRATTASAAEREGRRLLADLERRADRQRLGLEILADESGMTVAGLFDWWWKRKRGALRSHTVHGFLKKHLAEVAELPLPELTADRFGALLDSKARDLAPESLNKLRGRVGEMFRLAAKRGGPWEGRPNPIAEVERKRVVRALPAFLAAEQVPAVLAQLDGQERQVIATAVYTGMRKGEVGGLRKADIHLDAGEIWLQRCWDGPTTKDGKPAVLPIHPDLRPHLEAAIAASHSGLVFPRPDGSMHRPGVAWGEALQSALGAAGIVEGYEHGCRAHHCGWRARSGAPEPPGLCPTCGKSSTWSKPVPRHLTFKDLRHTTATLLLKAGVPLATVQRILRHSDPKLTAMIYGHLEVEDLRRGIERLQLGAPPAPPAPPEPAAPALALVVNAAADRTAPGLRPPRRLESEGPAAPGNPEQRQGLQMVGATGCGPATACPVSAATRFVYGAPENTRAQPGEIAAPGDPSLSAPDACSAPERRQRTAPGLRAPAAACVRRALERLADGDSAGARSALLDALRALGAGE